MKKIMYVFTVTILATIILSSSISYANNNLNDFITEKEAIERASDFISNSKFWSKRFDNISVIGNNITKIYDSSGAFIAYYVDVQFDNDNGYVLVGSKPSIPVLQVGQKSFIEKENMSHLAKNDKVMMEKRYIFAGLQNHIVEYNYKDGTKDFIDIYTGEKILDIKSLRPLMLSSDKEDILSKDSFDYSPFSDPPAGELDYPIPILDQNDLGPDLRGTGCGPTTGAAILWYLAENDSEYSSIINHYKNNPIALAKVLFYDMQSYIGTTVPYYRNGINARLSALELPEATFKTTSLGYSNLWNSIKTGIDVYDSPVALFVGTINLPYPIPEYPEPELSTLHWVAINAWWTDDQQEDYIGYMTWGALYEDNFRAVYEWRNNLTTVYIR